METAPDHWLGKDGGNCYRVQICPDEIRVESTGTAADFRSFLRLDESLNLAQDLAKLGPELAPMIDALPGFRLLRPSDPVETLFCFLCTPNNHLGRITKMVQNLAAYGDPITVIGGRTMHRFPDLERISKLEEGELRALGFGYRAKTIPKAAQEILSNGGLKWLADLKTAALKDARHSLMELSGVGPKLADCIALYALHHTTAVPVDTHLWQAACNVYFKDWIGMSLTTTRYQAVGETLRERFGDRAGHAHLFLYYHHLQTGRGKKVVS